MDSSMIIGSIEAVTKKWAKHRKQEERGRAQSRRAALTHHSGPSIKYAAWRTIPAGYKKVSNAGQYPVMARQLYYACRGEILEATGKPTLNSHYFTQTIVPEYIQSHPKETADWDITYDARGHFGEPHTGVITPLGTLDVRQYLVDMRDHVVKTVTAGDFVTNRAARFPTHGPKYRFSAVLFIEKEGFMPLFEAANLAERYDIAIMSTKGMPVVACRHLADELCGKHNIPLLVLHDFDKSGFSILGTLAGVLHYDKDCNERNPRYEYRHEFDVIDLGLRLPDVHAYNLASEAVRYKSDPCENLDENGATPEEIKFLCGDHGWYNHSGQRVELNAFTSGDFIRWIEARLKSNGVKKVVPDAEILENAYRRAVQIELIRDRLGAVVEAAGQEAQKAKLPKNLDRVVRKAFQADPGQSWDRVIAAMAAVNCKKRRVGEAAFQQAKSVAAAGGNLSTAPPGGKRPRGRPRKHDPVVAAVSLAELGINEKLARSWG